MKMLPALLVCAMMALTRAAAVPEAEPGENTEPCIQGGKSRLVKRDDACGCWTAIGDRCFYYIRTLFTWANAARNCQRNGGNLASVHSLSEYRAIQDMIREITGTYPLAWVGGSDSAQEGTWFWNDGTPWDFRYWASGQPDNFFGLQDCMLMNFGDGNKFDDHPCYWHFPSVCATSQ